ncbi:hypothetical protein [Roseospirillum parvum]|uniref:Uncharacterized protein n=1 Tax=Roseospirillum parvum TaxID=83401 RepID=A0A1G8CXE4_9PROT|nr:hypothetical protein [Roseospirillum parvum]SDH49863.1 hypothetical protein SAMN05421742_107119 [Roseospirillum parvum]
MVRTSLAAAALLAVTAGPAAAEGLSVTFADAAWDGEHLPAGQHCSKFGGHGATPPLVVSGIPAPADAIVIEYNDRSYQPLSEDGGHGIIGYRIAPGSPTAELPAVPGETAEGLPEGTWIVRQNRATGSYARPGYLPPCSGGKGNTYVADVFAVRLTNDGYEKLAEARVTLGRY